ncbi:MAG: efflux RND transporter permease subunit [Psychromonas sp.]|nr:efflux RND transporter permease subunit [Alteromonadales bacterium]MCP5077241.1 efflux RND transporter permease subunit [Psychromonas sp.]
MNLTEFAFNYKKPVLLILLLLLINGMFAYFTLPAQEDPSITIREAIITTNYPGMAPDRIERLVTKTLEEAIRKIPEVEKITSTSTTGQSVIHAKVYDRYFNLENIWQDLRNKIKEVEHNLPDGTHTPFVNDSFGDVSVITLALTADGFTLRQMSDIAGHIRDNLYTIKGTKKIDILGKQQQYIFLEASNAKFAQLGLSPSQIINELQQQNIISSGGEIDIGSKAIVIEPSGNYNSVKEIAKTRIRLADGKSTIALQDIATISRDYIDPPHQPAYYNGEKAIMFSIAMLPEQNLLDYAPKMKQRISEIENSLPIGYKLDYATYQATEVENSVRGVSYNVLQTLAIVLVVVILFLGVRTGLIVGSIVPFVMLVTLAIMQYSGMALETMSLATLIIALGLLVDNGIVVAEDFKRRIEQGDKRYSAMIQGGKELALPLLSSSATTVLFFLPLMLAEHISGEFTRSISLVIFITLFSSWVLALTVTPILCYYFIKPDKKQSNQQDDTNANKGFYHQYEICLHWLLQHKVIFLGAMVVCLIAATAGFKSVPQQFFPDSSRSQIMMYVDLPIGSSAKQTNKQMQAIFKWLDESEEFPQIENYSAYSGFNGPRFVTTLSPEDPANNKGFIVFNVTEETDLTATVNQLHNAMLNEFPNLSARVKRMFAGPSDSSVIEIQVKGPDKAVIYAKAEQIKTLLQKVANTKNIRTDWEDRITKIEVKIDQNRARLAGVSSQDIANALQGFFSGSEISQYREGDEIIPILFRANENERSNLDRLRTVSIFSESSGHAIPLFQVADFLPVNQYAKIQREDMFNTITVKASNTEITAQDLKVIIDEQVNQLKQDLPLNHSIEYDGVVVDSEDAQQALAENMPMVIALILVLLVMLFNSYRNALIIVLTIPLAIIGTIIGLLVMNAPYGFMVTLGIYSLAGIIINNAIVLIDRIDIEKKNGHSDYQAIINSCLTRLRPIAMTTVTTIMGLLPLLLDPSSMFYGMATVLAFGLGLGTILTLGVVPVLYASFYKVNR